MDSAVSSLVLAFFTDTDVDLLVSWLSIFRFVPWLTTFSEIAL